MSGLLNDVEFTITRTKSSSKGVLSFQVGEDDLTGQSNKETQARIDEHLGLGSYSLARAIFHGQHDIRSILEATDSKLKEELSAVAPLETWKALDALSRKERRDSQNRAVELGGKKEVQKEYLHDFIREFEVASDDTTKQREALLKIESDLEAARKSTLGETLDSARAALNTSMERIKRIEKALDSQRMHIEEKLSDLREKENSAERAVSSSEARLERAMESLERLKRDERSAEERIAKLESKWHLNLTNGISEIIEVPDVCPTCRQPLPLQNENEHHRLEETIKREAEEQLSLRSSIATSVAKKVLEVETAKDALQVAKQKMKAFQAPTEESGLLWETNTSDLQSRLEAAREEQREAADTLSRAMNDSTSSASLESKLAIQKGKLELSEENEASKKKQVQKCRDELAELTKELDANERRASLMDELSRAFGQFGVQSFVLQSTIDLLERTTQQYLDVLSGGTQQLQLSLDERDKIARKAYVVGRQGQLTERPLSSLSGGQWRRCSLALGLGFTDLLSLRSGFQANVLLLDEPLTHLDRSGRTAFGNLCRTLLARNRAGLSDLLSPSTIVVILQDLAAEELEEAFDREDEVVRSNGASYVIVDD